MNGCAVPQRRFRPHPSVGVVPETDRRERHREADSSTSGRMSISTAVSVASHIKRRTRTHWRSSTNIEQRDRIEHRTIERSNSARVRAPVDRELRHRPVRRVGEVVAEEGVAHGDDGDVVCGREGAEPRSGGSERGRDRISEVWGLRPVIKEAPAQDPGSRWWVQVLPVYAQKRETAGSGTGPRGHAAFAHSTLRCGRNSPRSLYVSGRACGMGEEPTGDDKVRRSAQQGAKVAEEHEASLQSEDGSRRTRLRAVVRCL